MRYEPMRWVRYIVWLAWASTIALAVSGWLFGYTTLTWVVIAIIWISTFALLALKIRLEQQIAKNAWQSYNNFTKSLTNILQAGITEYIVNNSDRLNSRIIDAPRELPPYAEYATALTETDLLFSINSSIEQGRIPALDSLVFGVDVRTANESLSDVLARAEEIGWCFGQYYQYDDEYCFVALAHRCGEPWRYTPKMGVH